MTLVATPRTAAPSLELASATADAASARRSSVHRDPLRAALLASVAPARLREPVPDALAPPVDRLGYDVYRLGRCMAGTGIRSNICELGDTTALRRLVVLGDSHAEMWMPAFVHFAAADHWRLVPLIKDGCVPYIMGSGDCATWYRWARDEVRRLHPRVVALSEFWSSWGPGGVAAVAGELRDLAPLTHRLIVIEDPPARDRAAIDCLLARGATLGSCAFPVSPREAEAYASVRREASAAHAGYARTLQWFCARKLCPTVVGTIVTYRDKTHITGTYARLVGAPLAKELAVTIGR